jgi:hypothetical protein
MPNAVESHGVLQKLIKGNMKNDNTIIEWNENAMNAFNKCKSELQNAMTLVFPSMFYKLCLNVDASDNRVGAVLNLSKDNNLEPLGFIPKDSRTRKTDTALTIVNSLQLIIRLNSFAHLWKVESLLYILIINH